MKDARKSKAVKTFEVFAKKTVALTILFAIVYTILCFGMEDTIYGGKQGTWDYNVPMKKSSGHSDLWADAPADTSFTGETNPACWSDPTIVSYNSDPSRDGEVISQPTQKEAETYYNNWVESNTDNNNPVNDSSDEEYDQEDQIIAYEGDAGIAYEAQDTSEPTESNPETDGFVGDVELTGEIDWSLAD